jgi:hypothetical protein
MNKQQTAMRQMYNHLLYKRDVYQKAEMYESVATLETSIELAEILLEIEEKQMSNNKQQTAVEWLWEIAYNRELTVEDWKQAKEMYQDEIEAAIIKDCATESTSAAHKFSVFRDQIIEAFDQGVIAEFTHQVSGAPETSGQEYFNQTYGDGIQ